MAPGAFFCSERAVWYVVIETDLQMCDSKTRHHSSKLGCVRLPRHERSPNPHQNDTPSES